jgi:TnpA family transposase
MFSSFFKNGQTPVPAIIEVGRINKTLYLLNYIDNEDYRRRILTQLNRGEGRHSVARIICHGQRGEIRKRYREGQEDPWRTFSYHWTSNPFNGGNYWQYFCLAVRNRI